MTIWSPDLERCQGPKYLALADAIAADVEAGRLDPGTRLPTHRELADQLSVTVGTVSRGYAEALRRGLIRGEVGRGTFVAPRRSERELGHWLCVPQFSDPDVITMHLNTPTDDGAREEVRQALLEVANCSDLSPLLHYQHSAGVRAHRRAGARWFELLGFETRVENVIVATGGQHAITMVLASVLDAGDLLLCEELVYQGVTNAAHLLNLRVQGLPMDGDGVLPEAFEAACVRSHPRAIYLTPTFQNPTACVMPLERRRAIAAIAQRHGVAVIEDDIYSFYAEAPLPTITSMVGDLGFFLSSMSKSIAPGLRIAFIHAPERAIDELIDTVWSSTIMAPPLMGAVATSLIESGAAERVFDRRREAARRQQALVTERLGEFVSARSDRRCAHVWLDLPDHWRSSDFVAAARSRDVAVAAADMFTVGQAVVPHALRISLGAQRDDAELIRGLDVVADLLHGAPQPRRTSI